MGEGTKARLARPRAVGAGLLRMIGIVAVIVVANYLLGLAWDTATGSDPGGGGETAAPLTTTPVTTTRPTPAAPSTSASTTTATTEPWIPPPDPREETQAMRRYPWARAYFAEMERTAPRYWPYILDRAKPFHGTYFNFAEGVRRSYQPRTPGPAPTVAFFGGSTMWGEGQRDQGTIASAVARLADRDGLPIRVENRGVRGNVLWSEVLELEDRVAGSGSSAPLDMAVFYDGWNDCNVQVEAPQPGQPYDLLADEARDRFDQRAVSRARAEARDREKARARQLTFAMVVSAYQRHSLLERVRGKVSDLIGGEPAGADELDPQLAAHCADVYERARARALEVADEHDVEVSFFWQPLDFSIEKREVFRDAVHEVGPPTIDLRYVGKGREKDIYIDPGHMNELGATLVAEAMWKHLRPTVAAWHARHG